jgi:subtilase family serine protease
MVALRAVRVGRGVRWGGCRCSGRRARRLVASVLAVAAVLIVTGLAAAVQAQPTLGRAAVAGDEPLWTILPSEGGSATVDLGPAGAGAPVSVRVYLTGRDPRGLAAYASAVSDPASPRYGKYVSPAIVQERFGPSAHQVRAVRGWLESAGLTVEAVTAHYIKASGTASQAQAAFGVAWHSFQVNESGTIQQGPPPGAQLTARGRVAADVLGVVPLEIGLPGSTGAKLRAKGLIARQQTRIALSANYSPDAAPTPPPCSTYWGQNAATTLPPAYGQTQPYLPCGYTPQQLRSAYGVPHELTGTGVTVAVVHPWRQPNAAQDVATFGSGHGEPLGSGQLTELLQPGLDQSCANGIVAGPYDLSNEETGDLEAVHDMAPNAKLIYLGTNCDDDLASIPDLDALTRIVDKQLASIVSNSWALGINALSSPGLIRAYEQIFQQGALEGIGFYFAAGDSGDNATVFPDGKPHTFYPTSDPWATSVGGTSIAISQDNRYQWETGWGDDVAGLSPEGTSWAGLPGVFAFGSGGGTSDTFAQPFYQHGVVPISLSEAHGSSTPMRVIPDIAADADLATAVLGGATINGTFVQGPGFGTSVSCPLIAGIQADAEQAAWRPLGFANPAIYTRYRTPAYHDVTDQPLGPSISLADVVPGDGGSPPLLATLGHDHGLAATPGYDNVTGVGTPTTRYFRSYPSRQAAAGLKRNTPS